MLMFFSILAGLSLFYATNPFMGSLFLVILTFILMVKISFSVSQWVAYILMLLFLGGMMVMFLYVTSIMSTLKFKIKVKTKSLLSIFILSALFSYSLTENTFKDTHLSDLFNSDSAPYIVLCVVYLITGLLVVVSISKKFEGSLKSMLND